MKTYSNRSNAVRAAKAQFGAEYEQHVKIMLAVDSVGFNLVPVAPLVAPQALVAAPAVVEVAEVDSASVYGHSVHGLVHCPRCETHLSNGVIDFDSLAEQHGAKAAWLMQAKEYACMGCGHEFGADVDEPGTKAKPVATGTGIKIQKERATQNDVTRPSAGGICDAIWTYCEQYHAQHGKAPTAKEIKAHAASQAEPWSPVTTTIQYYAFRKFMGIRGRQ